MIWLILAAGIGEVKTPPTVDIIEVNTVVETDGNHAFTQVILRKFHPETNGFRVSQWFMSRDKQVFTAGNRVVWYSRGERYEVRALRYFRTYSRLDPEVLDRKRLKPSRRIPYFRLENDNDR